MYLYTVAVPAELRLENLIIRFKPINQVCSYCMIEIKLIKLQLYLPLYGTNHANQSRQWMSILQIEDMNNQQYA